MSLDKSIVYSGARATPKRQRPLRPRAKGPSPAVLAADALRAKGLPVPFAFKLKPAASLGPFALQVRLPIPHSKTKTTRTEWVSEGQHAWLVDCQARTMRPVKLETLSVREGLRLPRASKKQRFTARQTVMAGTEGQHRYLVQAVLDEMRAARSCAPTPDRASGEGRTTAMAGLTAGAAA